MAPRYFVLALAGLLPAAPALAGEAGETAPDQLPAPIVVTGRGLSAAQLALRLADR